MRVPAIVVILSSMIFAMAAAQTLVSRPLGHDLKKRRVHSRPTQRLWNRCVAAM